VGDGRIILAARLTRALGRIGADRMAEFIGGALPRRVDQLARQDVVAALLRRHCPRGSEPLPTPRSVRLPGVHFESSNCTNFLIEVEFEPASDGADLPRSLYVKMPCPELATRAFADAVGFWNVEATFCERIATTVPIRVPRVYAVARRGARFVLLLENLGEDPATELFINRDMAAGTTPARARMCLSTLAALHAHFWGWSQARREALLPAALHPFLGPRGRDVSRALNAAAIAPAHRAAPDIFSADCVEICRLAIAKWDELIDSWYGEPLTLIHGDSHYANYFEYRGGDGPRMGMLDFQGLQWCRSMRDVHYFLTYSLETEVLAAHEDDLIEHYLDELAARGVEVDRGEARQQYRSFALQTLMVGVVSIGLGSLTEREDTVRTVLRRSVAALERQAFGDWLRQL